MNLKSNLIHSAFLSMELKIFWGEALELAVVFERGL